ncbi:hypothetical protein [Streptomyces sp. NPDC050422]|uniref:hypothetical protein n=1 Tax=Streptomyces sp. NPDC050422 TaxID=3365614 RepID=UPI00379ECD3F
MEHEINVGDQPRVLAALVRRYSGGSPVTETGDPPHPYISTAIAQSRQFLPKSGAGRNQDDLDLIDGLRTRFHRRRLRESVRFRDLYRPVALLGLSAGPPAQYCSRP